MALCLRNGHGFSETPHTVSGEELRAGLSQRHSLSMTFARHHIAMSRASQKPWAQHELFREKTGQIFQPLSSWTWKTLPTQPSPGFLT